MFLTRFLFCLGVWLFVLDEPINAIYFTSVSIFLLLALKD